MGYEVEYREDGVYLSLRRGVLGEDGQVAVGVIPVYAAGMDVYLTDGERREMVWEGEKGD